MAENLLVTAHFAPTFLAVLAPNWVHFTSYGLSLAEFVMKGS
jgi:hypothetical protein